MVGMEVGAVNKLVPRGKGDTLLSIRVSFHFVKSKVSSAWGLDVLNS